MHVQLEGDPKAGFRHAAGNVLSHVALELIAVLLDKLGSSELGFPAKVGALMTRNHLNGNRRPEITLNRDLSGTNGDNLSLAPVVILAKLIYQ